MLMTSHSSAPRGTVAATSYRPSIGTVKVAMAADELNDGATVTGISSPAGSYTSMSGAS
ncbi:MAG: hypothetical protein R2690_13820 [Acidimicrobiales bacterium]